MSRSIFPSEPKNKLRDRIKPSILLHKELKAQMISRNLKDDDEFVKIDMSTKSQLETFLWRDIEYFNKLEYSDSAAIDRSLARLREKTLFISVVDELVSRQTGAN